MTKRGIRSGQIERKYFAIPQSGDDSDGIVITTPAVDHYGDRVMPDGADLSVYLRNPVVMWLHDAYGYTDAAGIPIGTARSLEIVPGVGIRCTGIDWLENDDFTARVKNAWDQKKIRAASIGFLPLKGGWKENEFGGYDFLRWLQLEFSLVPIPANPEAVRGGLSVAMKMFQVDLDTSLWTPRSAEPQAKAGRVLSKKNLDRLKQAAVAIGDVIAAAEAEAEDEGETDSTKGLTTAQVQALVAEAFTETTGSHGGAR